MDWLSQGASARTISYSNITFIAQKQLVHTSAFKVNKDHLHLKLLKALGFWPLELHLYKVWVNVFLK